MDHIIWRHTDGQSLEYCQFTFGAATAIRGTVVGELQAIRGTLTYEVDCRPDGSTHWVHGWVKSERGAMSWTLHRQESDIWLVNGTPDPRLAACQDVDIGMTPATNTLPIRRINLQVGTSHECSAAWVRFPDLALHPDLPRCLPIRIPQKRISSRAACERTGGRTGVPRAMEYPIRQLARRGANQGLFVLRMLSDIQGPRLGASVCWMGDENIS